MTIRPYQDKDEHDVLRLWQECGLIIPANNPLQDIKRKQSEHPEWFLVGIEDDQVIASCMAGYEGHRGVINYLAVTPSRQGEGLASQIMEVAENILRDVGCPKINLMVRSSNKSVTEFYQKLGWIEDEVVCFSKRLAEPDEAFDE